MSALSARALVGPSIDGVAIPSPGSVITFEQLERAERQITESLPDMHDIAEIQDTRDRLRAIEQYLRGKEMHLPALGAQRRLEARIGQLLGPTSQGGRPTDENPRHDEGFQMRGDERADFRILARALNGEVDMTGTEWRQSRRALVALIKSRTETEEADVSPSMVVQPAQGPRINIPEGVTAEEWCRKGLAMEAQSIPPDQVAAELGIGVHTYRRMRDIVILADHPDLSAKDAATADRARRIMNSTEQIGHAWPLIEPIAVRVWGAKQLGISRDRAERNRHERFEHAFGLLLQACATVAEFDIPYLSEDRATEAAAQIDAASRNLAALKRRIAEIRG